MKSIKRLYDWMGTRVYSPYADHLLSFLFYLEAIFFLPTDPMLILYCIERPKRGYYYATIATAASVLGGLTGYFIGYTLWETLGEQIIHNRIINLVLTPSMFEHLRMQFQQFESWAIFIAGFTPVPYKAATLSAGFCKLPLIPFIVCSIIGRGLRFYLYALTIGIWGRQMKYFIDRYFNLLVILAGTLIAAGIWFIKR